MPGTGYSRPLLLLDVDGVLNPFPELPAGYVEHQLFPEDDEPVRLAPWHPRWIQELMPRFEIVWATGWGDEANRLLCPIFGIDELDYVRFPPVPFDPAEKVPAIAAHAADRAVAWVDDNITEGARQWAAGRTPRTLLVEVDPSVGLERKHVDALLAWAGLAGE